MGIKIVTGYKGEAHITSQQDRDKHRGIFGNDSYILDVGSLFAPEVISANEVTIADGTLSLQGCIGSIGYGYTESLAIDNGTQDMFRKDLIVCRYTKAPGTGIEDLALAVIKGTPAASDPEVPTYTSGSIAGGDTTVEMPLFVVNIDGISIESIDRVANVVPCTNDLYGKINTLLMFASTSSGTITIASGGTQLVEVDVSRSNRRPVAVVGVHALNADVGGQYSTYCMFGSFYIVGNTAKVQIRNLHPSANAVIRVIFYIMYM